MGRKEPSTIAKRRYYSDARTDQLMRSSALYKEAFAKGKNCQGKDGKACVLKAICKASKRDRDIVGKGTFLEEILHTIFTLPDGFYELDPMTEYEEAYWKKENCDEYIAKCPDVF
ncbi:hypothetical protein HZH66_010550 [Vespula vulgaris]|uniref:Uncharacterized protein n=2 Tax=Vespula TaxID=7451 RepID=A0A834KTP0_VESPE|nr:hypothetical protein HZH66_010550 [Vespula vulgaris]KAF7412783.1 hypothetical protein H0235_012634 [Vespula pensylvanica]